MSSEFELSIGENVDLEKVLKALSQGADQPDVNHEGMLRCDKCGYFNILTWRDKTSACHRCGRHL